ncbi:MAG TPA: HNH endonuclease signature motif containing protein [Candidatus Nitrosocosmicus sp.]|nr:HNH endonuclease signature motif containing protein [Candidatus Nitrosocosmicus sp.]
MRVIKRFEFFPFGICKCGCGQPLVNFTGSNGLLRKYIYKHRKNKPIIPKEVNYCACGCNRKTTLYKGRYRKYILGHNGKGANNGCWKGGRIFDGRYWRLYMPWHPNANKKGKVYEHVWIMSRHLKRPLMKGEEIDHINEDKTDNRIENLRIMTKPQHTSRHFKGKPRKKKINNIL